MMNDKRKTRSSWQRFVSMPQKFSYEVDAPINNVLSRLAETEQDARFLHRSSQDLSVMPTQGRYVFRLRRRSYGTITATAEGQIWQDDTGCVIVEGETQINGWSWIVPLVLMSLFGIGLSIVSMPAASRYILLIPFFVTMVLGFGTSLFMYARDRRELMKQLNEAMTDSMQAQGKQKRYSHLEIEDSETASQEYDIVPDERPQRRRDGQ